MAEVDIFHAFEIPLRRRRRPRSARAAWISSGAAASLRFLSGDANDILRSLPDRDRAIVTEPFADKHHVRAGDVLQIPLGVAHRAL